MKIVMIKGFSKTGKTTTVTAVIRELVERGYSVGTIKDIHFKGFTMDNEERDTGKHAFAGATTVTAIGVKETDVMYKKHLSGEEVLKHYTEDFVIIEGDCGVDCKNIITGKKLEDLHQRMDKNTIAFSGIVSGEINEYNGLPVINGQSGISDLVDLIEKKVTVRKD